VSYSQASVREKEVRDLRKWIRFLLMLSIVFWLCVAAIPVFANDISNVTAEIDSNKIVTIKGVLSSGAGQAVSIQIIDPQGKIEYLGSTVSDSLGNFRLSYKMTNTTAGNYAVTINALGFLSPVKTSFAYGANNNLKALAISSGGFDKAFSPETTEYSVSVDRREKSITVTPTVSDGTASVKVNDKDVASDTASDPIPLQAGNNTITVAVTALTGESKTYTISVIKEKELLSSISAGAKIDADRRVTVSGIISSGAGQQISLKIIDPKGNIEYVNNTSSSNNGEFAFAYNMTGTITGRYAVKLGALGIAQPITTYFDYTAGVELKDLVLSNVSLSPDFRPDQIAYTALADKSVNSVTVTPAAGEGTAAIKINEKEIASGRTSEPITLNEGANIIHVTALSQDGVLSKTYTITVTKDSDLSKDGYVTAEVNKKKLVTISGATGLAAEQQVSVMIRDPNDQLEYINTTKSTAEGKFLFTYKISNSVKGKYSVIVGAEGIGQLTTEFIYEPINLNLEALTINKGSLTPEFSSDQTEYSTVVDYDSYFIRVTPTAVDPSAILEVNGTEVASGKKSGRIGLSVGHNIINVVVTTPDKTETKTYIIDIERKDMVRARHSSSNADLSSLVVSAGTLTPEFSAGTISYTAAVAHGVNSLTVTPTVAESHATVEVNGTAVESGNESGAINLAVGDNTITVLVTAQDGTTKTYTVTVTRAEAPVLSSNADLSSLVLNAGTLTPEFAAGTTSYTAAVVNGVNSLTVTPTVAESHATAKVNDTPVGSGSESGVIDLAVGDNVITILVTAQDGTTKTYTVTVTRAEAPPVLSSNADLSGLVLSEETLTPEFAAGTTSYTAAVANEVNSLTVTPTVAESHATVEVTDTEVESGSESGAIDLAVGNNTITVRVTAQDGTTKTYTVTVTRAEAPPVLSSNADLSSLVLYTVTVTEEGLDVSERTLSPEFAPDATDYIVDVDCNVSSIRVTPTVAEIHATVEVKGTPVESGSMSDDIALAGGITRVQIEVTAQDGTTKMYTISVLCLA